MQREKINIGKFVASYFDVRQIQFGEHNIKVILTNVEAAPTVRINRGRLLQVLDNLVRNSQYWVLVAGKHNAGLERQICVDFSPKGFTLSDSGRGVREALENSLFELFVTDKPGGEASGMGLFITKTLLELERCNIDLLPERNASGRRFKFLVDLSNVRA
jgi:signal transduction histidine kinase